MFSEKYHKQLLSLLPLMQLQSQEQSVHPSNKHNNDGESEECFTPNYNVIEEDQCKQYQGEDHQHFNDKGFNRHDDNQNHVCFKGQYQRMRQNLNIDYQTFFSKKLDFTSKLNYISSQTELDFNIQPYKSSGQFSQKQFNQSCQDGFQPNFKKDQQVEQKNRYEVEQKKSQKQGQIKNKASRNGPKQNYLDEKNKIYELISVNGQALTQQCLQKNQSMRWRLIKQLIRLNQQVQPQDNNSSEGDLAPTHTKGVLIGSSNPMVKYRSLSDSLLNQLCQIQKNICSEQQDFFSLQKVTVLQHSLIWQLADGKISDLSILIDQDLKNQEQVREKKQQFAFYQYVKLKNQAIRKYQEILGESTKELQQNIEKLFQKANLNLTRTKRLLKGRTQNDQHQILVQIQQVQNQLGELPRKHQQSLERINLKFTGKCSLISQQIHQLKKKVLKKQIILQDKLERADTQFTKHLNRETQQAELMQKEFLKLLQKLIQKMQ